MKSSNRRPPPNGWKKGQSGNPAGRPPGSGKVAELRAAIAGHVPAILDKLTAAALAGDVSAARLLLERVIPPLKGAEEPAPLALPPGTLTEQGRAVVSAIAAGDMAPGQGASMLASLSTLAKLSESDDLERRVADLEAGASASSGGRK